MSLFTNRQHIFVGELLNLAIFQRRWAGSLQGNENALLVDKAIGPDSNYYWVSFVVFIKISPSSSIVCVVKYEEQEQFLG